MEDTRPVEDMGHCLGGMPEVVGDCQKGVGSQNYKVGEVL